MDYALIMAGGSGTRLWPLSREGRPKQSLQLVGERSMFQHAVDRLAPLFPTQDIWVVTRDEHAGLLHAQTPELPANNLILEPQGRGTAPAIGLAAIHLRRADPQAVMAVLTADHYITDTARFRQVLAAALDAARQGHLVTLGIKPANPSTGYGYIEQGPSLGEVEGFPVFQRAALHRKTRPPDGCPHGRQRQLFLEQRHVHLAGAAHPGRVRAPDARVLRPPAGSGSCPGYAGLRGRAGAGSGRRSPSRPLTTG